MRLGTETASLVNNLYSRGVVGQPTPTVGMGATLLGWTDRSPATVVDVFMVGKTQYLTVQCDDYKRVDSNGMSEIQEYAYTANTEGSKLTFRTGRSGKWESVCKNPETGRWVKSNGNGLRIGKRERYYDFSF